VPCTIGTVPTVGSPEVLQQALIDRVLDGPGVTTSAQRRAAYGTGTEGLPAEAVAVIEKVRKHAYKVTDEDIAALKAAGLDEERIFELTIATALGVSKRRLDAAMKAINEVGP
jgi:alkylhydroperoxidase family enzyme